MAIECWSNRGPAFAAGNGYELCAFDEPFNGNGNCYSLANKNGYAIPLQDDKNMLTDKSNRWFSISELEVWEVKYLD